MALRRSLDSLTFLPFNLEIERDFLAAVKGRHRLYLGFRPFKFRVDLVIHVGIQAAESVVAIRIRKAAAHCVGPQVLQEHHAVGKGRLRFVGDDPSHGTQLRLFLGVLRAGDPCEYQHNHKDAGYLAVLVHFLSPAFPGARGSSRNDSRSCTAPASAFTVCDCSLKFLACTSTSYSLPSGTRTANSPRELVYVSQRNFFSLVWRMRTLTSGNESAFSLKIVPVIR